jgi:NADPH-dependent ferric siderophore reductase
MKEASSIRKVQRIRHETKRRLLDVTRVERMSPGFVRVTLGGAELEGFTSLSFDDHLKIFLGLDASVPDDRGIMRDFTPRSFDPAKLELTLEFALHGEGAATAWAAQVAPGQQLWIGGPRGSLVIPTDYDWQLLIGDETALPAIARRLEEMPSGANVFTFIQLDDAADRRKLETRAKLVEMWMATRPDGLAEAMKDFKTPTGEGFAWAAGEAKAISAVRAVLVDTHGLDKDHIRAAAYWKSGTSAHHENLGD